MFWFLLLVLVSGLFAYYWFFVRVAKPAPHQNEGEPDASRPPPPPQNRTARFVSPTDPDRWVQITHTEHGLMVCTEDGLPPTPMQMPDVMAALKQRGLDLSPEDL